jgi:class 3 adenylate cyclase
VSLADWLLARTRARGREPPWAEGDLDSTPPARNNGGDDHRIPYRESVRDTVDQLGVDSPIDRNAPGESGPFPSANALGPDDLLALVRTAGELAQEIDLQPLLRRILVRAGELTGCPDGCVLLFNEERNSLYFADAIGDKAPQLLNDWGEFSEQQVPLEGSKAGEVFTTGEPLVEDSLSDDPGHFKPVDAKTDHQTRCMICVPLSAAGVRLGVVQLLNKESGKFTARDQILLEQFANQAALGIRNARLMQDLLAHMGFYAIPEPGRSTVDLLATLRAPAHSERLTVMFADMRGFSQLHDAVRIPEKTQSLLNEYVAMLSDRVLQHGGVVNKFLGDGVMALFREDKHEERAVRAAFAMLDDFPPLRQRWDDDQDISADLQFLDIGIGIATGDVMLGTIGSTKVRDFTAIGTAVNLAAAFEQDARAGKRILVNHGTYAAVKERVAEIEGPESYELRKPDQPRGVLYKQYHLKSLTHAVRSKAFISHSHLDREFVEAELIPPLAENGVGTWYSRDDIRGGDVWVKSIREGLNQCDWVLVIVSENSANSDWVSEEVDIAFASGRFKGKIVPLARDGTPLERVNPLLQHLQAIDARRKAALAEELRQILRVKAN